MAIYGCMGDRRRSVIVLEVDGDLCKGGRRRFVIVWETDGDL